MAKNVDKAKGVRAKLPTVLLVAVLVCGLGLLAYPTLSDAYNQAMQSRAVATYQNTVDALADDARQARLASASAYNEALAARGTSCFVMDSSEQAAYDAELSADAAMSYLEIPTLDVRLPVYHGTDDSALAAGIGHLAGSSLPVGGSSTHCVLSGHRGLPSAKLLTDLDKMQLGDVFVLHTLGTTLTYEVDRISVVEPDDTSELGIEPGQDLCTLFTCTPYGINTQRLLVRGHRVDNLSETQLAQTTGYAAKINPLTVVPFVAVAILAVTLALVLRRDRRKPKKPENAGGGGEGEGDVGSAGGHVAIRGGRGEGGGNPAITGGGG